MRRISRPIVTLALIVGFLSNGLTCGPGYVTPLFDTTAAPETPYIDFAAGRLGILKRTFRRSVLVAAYRHIAGNGLNLLEQQSLIEVWKAEIDNKDFRDDRVDEAVKAWIAARKAVLEKEEQTPEIYVERSYGGYDFFPNCSKNAFETASETLSDRITAHGRSDANVLAWIAGQDQVFENCARGRRTPDPTPLGAPMWLQKDREYQVAAAEFYSLNYTAAKQRFADIAQDTESPWRETADYLVARTLIRQASLSGSPEISGRFYADADAHLERFVSPSGKFAASAEGLRGLIAYRLRPRERTSELAKNISFYGGDERFRQNVIDYNWLLDKFETEILSAEEKRKAAEKRKENPAGTETSNVEKAAEPPANTAANSAAPSSKKQNDDDLEINIYSISSGTTYRIFVRADASDSDAIAEAERVSGRTLTEAMKKEVREARQRAYASRYSENVRSSYEGGYWGEERLTPDLVPAFIRQDEITDWLYAFQMTGVDAFLYSVKKYEERQSVLWLMTSLSQAEKSSPKLAGLMDAVEKVDRSSPAYPTIAYHTARLLLAEGKQAEARKLIVDMLGLGDSLPVTARNSFLDLRLKLVETLDEYLKFSLKKPFAFDFSGQTGTIEEIIAEQKSYYSPEYDKNGREAYDAEVEDRYKEEKLWQRLEMFDSKTIEAFNQQFPTTALIDVFNSPALPDHIRPRLAMAIWTRAFLLNDVERLVKFTPELALQKPEFAELLAKITEAKTPAARETAVLYFVLKNPILSPFIEDGVGKTDNELEEWDSDDWWCEPYDTEYDDLAGAERPKSLPPRPAFLTAAQTRTAQTERKQIKATGDAPKYLGAKVLAWARRSPNDRRIPEVLYAMIVANGWSKYGCGNNEELRSELAKNLKTRYPNSEWTAKLAADEESR